MGKVTTGNRLYFYQLLSREIGIGRQVLIPRVEEVLAGQDIEPGDLGFDSTFDLLSAMPELIKLTVFKKGRVYATLLQNEEFDGVLERLAVPAPAEKGAKAGPKSWKRKKGPKDPTPAKPRKRIAEAAVEPESAPEAEAETATADRLEEGKPPADGLEPAYGLDEVSEASAEEPGEPSATRPPAPGMADELREEAPGAPAPEPASSISLTITYDPCEDVGEGLACDSREHGHIASPAEPAPAPAPDDERGLPRRFSDEVLMRDDQLRILYQLLPIDTNPSAALDEDWLFARSCGMVSGTRAKASFPLRFLHEDGTPVKITIKRTSTSPSGKRWALASIDGDDGDGASHEAVGIEGLPTMDEGAWSDLSNSSRRSGGAANPVRELAAFAQIGTWDTALGTLATMAAPERWNFHGEGVGQASRYGILREYLAVTFHRIMHEEKLCVAADGSLTAFDTGLLTPFFESIYAVLTPRSGAIPWKLSFAVAGSGDLGLRLAAAFDPLPEPARYLMRLEDILPETGRLLIIDTSTLLSAQLGRFPRAFITESLEANTRTRGLLAELVGEAGNGSFSKGQITALSRAIKADPGLYRRMGRAIQDAIELALRRARASYRIAAPVYDPADDTVKILLPLNLVDDHRADCAAVLQLMPSGAYQVSAVISLERAYACARVISAEQPRWLTPQPMAKGG